MDNPGVWFVNGYDWTGMNSSEKPEKKAGEEKRDPWS